jgi:hypothetical protein
MDVHIQSNEKHHTQAHVTHHPDTCYMDCCDPVLSRVCVCCSYVGQAQYVVFICRRAHVCSCCCNCMNQFFAFHSPFKIYLLDLHCHMSCNEMSCITYHTVHVCFKIMQTKKHVIYAMLHKAPACTCVV